MNPGALKLYLQALLVYVALDVAYQLAFGLALLTRLAESSGLSEIYVRPSGTGIALMAAFFLLIALANLRLCILPALAARSLPLATRNGALLGATAYATLGLTNAWSIGGFPLAAALVVTLEGCFLSLATSALVTWWHLRSAGGGRP